MINQPLDTYQAAPLTDTQKSPEEGFGELDDAIIESALDEHPGEHSSKQRIERANCRVSIQKKKLVANGYV